MQLQWTTVTRKVSDLVPYEFNPRKLSDEKKAKLIESLERFNLVEIPVIDFDGIIIAGHQRIKVLIAVGRGDEIIDVRIPNRKLTEKEFKEYNIQSNIQVGVWDVELLEEVFSDIDLKGLGVDLDQLKYMNVKTTFGEEEQGFDSTLPEIPLTKLGDLYEFKSISKNTSHRLLCGNSINSGDFHILMNSDLATMVFSDPPYNVKSSSISVKKSRQHNDFAMASGEMSEAEFTDFLAEVFTMHVNYSIDGSIHFICMDWRHIMEILHAGKSVYKEFKNMIVWNKNNAAMGSFYRSKHELIFVFKNGTKSHINNFRLGSNGRYRTNVWDYPSANSTKAGDEKEMLKDHPTPKPIDLIADAIIDCSNENNIILDSFSGTGTTIIASEKTHRQCRAIELDPKYCDLTVRRYSKYMVDNNLDFEILKNGQIMSNEQISEYHVKIA